MSGIFIIHHLDHSPLPIAEAEILLAINPEWSQDGYKLWSSDDTAVACQYFWVDQADRMDPQPLVDSSRRCVLSADARIDNHDELATQLGLTAADLHLTSDARMILLSYLKWGPACVEYLRGDFVFIILDIDEHSIFIARDPLGTRSLAYYRNDKLFIAASEINQIISHPEVPVKINENRIAEYLVNDFHNQEDTYYSNIHYLPPGSCLHLKPTGCKTWSYWQIDPERRIRYRNDDQYAEHFLELLQQAVNARLRSTGTIAVSMSGGLDSSSVAALTSQYFSNSSPTQSQLPVFSYSFQEFPSLDEFRYIQPMQQKFNLQYHPVNCDQTWTLNGYPGSWPVDIGYPLGDAYALLPENLAKTAGQAGVRLLLSGYYGDVLFEGGWYWASSLLQGMHLGTLFQQIRHFKSRVVWKRDIWDHGIRPFIPNRIRRIYRAARPRPDVKIGFAVNPEFLKKSPISRLEQDSQGRAIFPAPGMSSRFQSLTLNLFSQGAAATRKLYLRNGIELETPYWDRSLVEFVMAVPADQLHRPEKDRYLFRNAMKGILPSEVVNRRDKTNFFPLFEKGLLEKEVETVRKILQHPQILERQYINADWHARTLAGLPGTIVQDPQIWSCICLEIWLQEAMKVER